MTPQREGPIRVIVVEDESPQRAELLRMLQRDGDISILGLARSAPEALTLVAQVRPDVVIVDLHLADGGAKHTIEQVMNQHPTPILVLAAPSENRQSPCAVEALLAGAVDALPRPGRWTPELGLGLRRSVLQASRVAVLRQTLGKRTDTPVHQVPVVRSGGPPIVAVGASTGGPSALAVLLAGLSGLAAPVLIVQHLHSDFTGGLLEWMARVSALPVAMAENDEIPRAGRVYLAPGDVHLRVGAHRRLELHDRPVSLHRPSADQLFQSVAQFGSAGIGVIMTGMGEDGAAGLLAMHRNGAQTFGQDETSCAVYGMPRAAHRLGAVTTMLPLDQLADAVQRAVRQVRR